MGGCSPRHADGECEHDALHECHFFRFRRLAWLILSQPACVCGLPTVDECAVTCTAEHGKSTAVPDPTVDGAGGDSYATVSVRGSACRACCRCATPNMPFRPRSRNGWRRDGAACRSAGSTCTRSRGDAVCTFAPSGRAGGGAHAKPGWANAHAKSGWANAHAKPDWANARAFGGLGFGAAGIAHAICSFVAHTNARDVCRGPGRCAYIRRFV